MSIYKRTLRRIAESTERQLEEISQGSGVSVSTLCKIKYKQTTRPRIDTVEKLVDFFEAQDAKQEAH